MEDKEDEKRGGGGSGGWLDEVEVDGDATEEIGRENMKTEGVPMDVSNQHDESTDSSGVTATEGGKEAGSEHSETLKQLGVSKKGGEAVEVKKRSREEEEEHILSPGNDMCDMLVMAESSSENLRITTSHQNSECSVDSLLSDRAYFLHLRVSHKSCAAYTYTPLNRPVGIDIPSNSTFFTSKKSFIQQVRTVFCFAIAERRLVEPIVYDFSRSTIFNPPSLSPSLPLPSYPMSVCLSISVPVCLPIRLSIYVGLVT